MFASHRICLYLANCSDDSGDNLFGARSNGDHDELFTNSNDDLSCKIESLHDGIVMFIEETDGSIFDSSAKSDQRVLDFRPNYNDINRK